MELSGSTHCQPASAYFCKNQFLNPKRSRSDPFFRALLKSPTGHGESVTKPVLKTAHYLFCPGLDFGNFPVERLFFS